MSQVVYTELEGQPLRWEYKGTVPRESRREASRTPTTWSVSQTNTNQKGNTTTTTAMDVFSSNQVGEIIKTPTNAVRTNQIQVYGLRIGSPPNRLNVEIRKAKTSTTEFALYSPTGTLGDVFLSAKTNYISRRIALSLSSGDNTIVTLNPQLPAGNNIIIASVNEATSLGDVRFSLKIRRGDNTIVDNNLIAVLAINKTQVLVAVDFSAVENQTYTLVINSNTAYSANLNIIFCVFQLPNVSFGKTSTTVSVGNAVTMDLLTVIPGFSTGVNAIIGVVGVSASTNIVNPLIQILKGPTVMSSTQFNAGDTPAAENTHSIVLSCLDTTPSSGTQYRLRIFNNTGTSVTCEGRLLILNVSGGDFFDSPAITESVPVTKTFSTTIQSNTEALIIWSEQISGTPSSGNGFITAGYRGWTTPVFRHRGGGGVFTTIPILLPAREDNPTVELSLISPSGNWTYEYKVLAIPIRTIPTTLTKTVKAEIKFPAGNIKDVTFRMKKVGLPQDPNIKAELFIDGYKIGETIIESSTLTETYQTFTVTASNILGNEAMLLITALGDQINTVALQTDSSTYQTWRKYYSNSNVFDGPPLALTVNSYRLIPSDDILASGSISASSVGTTAAWITINISPIVLRPNTYYAIIAYTIGGDASNKYQLFRGGQVGDAFEHLITSSNSGGSWTTDTTTDLSYQIMGYSMTRIYNGSIPNNIVTPLGKVLVALIVKAQTSGTMEFAGFDDHILACSPVSSTASSLTLITVLAPDAPRLRDVMPSMTLKWEIWAAGTGLATVAYTQRHTYYTTNPVYPKDFGFGELYLIADEIPPQGLVILNDNTTAALYNSSTTATRVDSYELFRVPVRKIEVVQEPSSGRIVMYLIGLP